MADGRWRPGQSGNPAGRPRGGARLAREAMASPAARAAWGAVLGELVALVDLMRDEAAPLAARVAAEWEIRAGWRPQPMGQWPDAVLTAYAQALDAASRLRRARGASADQAGEQGAPSVPAVRDDGRAAIQGGPGDVVR